MGVKLAPNTFLEHILKMAYMPMSVLLCEIYPKKQPQKLIELNGACSSFNILKSTGDRMIFHPWENYSVFL